MKRIAAILALALAAALPVAAPAAKHAASGGATATGVTCAAGDPVVWLNTATKVYHLPGTSYYGKTKHGKYLCQSDAVKTGAHAAKAGAVKAAVPADDATPSGMKKAKKKHRGDAATPAP